MNQLAQEKKVPEEKEAPLVVTEPLALPEAPAEATARRNADFKKMSAPDRRRAIARDVKAQIAAGHYTAEHMVYVETHRGNLERQIGRQLSRGDLDCAVCGVGSIFLSTMHLARSRLLLSDIGNNDFAEGGAARAKIRDHFGRDQLALIELAFEGSGADAGPDFERTCARYSIDDSQIERAVEFHDRHDPRGRSPTRLLRAIMDNIIEHGEFRP